MRSLARRRVRGAMPRRSASRFTSSTSRGPFVSCACRKLATSLPLGWQKDFIGRDALQEQKQKGIARKLVGFEMIDRGIARHGYPVVSGDKRIGVVTSGTQTPFLRKAIGMAYVPTGMSAIGTELTIDVRGRQSQARVVTMPFYKRNRTEP